MSVLVIDKPSGPSSFAVCKRVRALLGRHGEKVGHGGTLDPFASGVLPICIGEATKVIPYLLDADKAYDADVRFGMETDTQDRTGQAVAEHPTAGLSGAVIEQALGGFRGEIEQVPPMYSALKHEGRPLYVYARKGETIARPPRRVTVHALELLSFAPPDRARLRVRCSKGTYVRTLAADLGRRLGVGAHLLELRRTASGPFAIAQAIGLPELAARVAEGRELPALTPLAALAHLPLLMVDERQALVLRRGQSLTWDELCGGRAIDGPVCAAIAGPREPVLVALVARDGDVVKILRGFTGG